MLRIAIINQPFDVVDAGEEQRGSVAIVNWELTRGLSPRHEITLWAAAAKGQVAQENFGPILIRRVPYSAKSFHKAVDLISGRFSRGDPYMGWDSFYRDYGVKIAAALANETYDVVYVSTLSQYGPILRAALPKTKLVLHVHGDELDYFDRERTLRRLQAFDAIVTVSEFVSGALRRRFPEFRGPIDTIRNGVDVNRYKPRGPETGEGRKQLLFVSRISPDKGVHILARAFDLLAQKRDDVELNIVGKAGLHGLGFMRMHFDDPIVAPLREYYGRGLIDSIRKEILGQKHSYVDSIKRELSPAGASRVNWRGTVSLEELVRLYSTTSIFVLPSVWEETFGLPIVEGMAAGLPVVASRCGGIPEIIVEGRTGRMVERSDVQGLANALDGLLNDSALRHSMGVAGRARVEAEFTWAQAAARLEKTLLSLTGDRAAAGITV
jgi:glycosyltransferase involved in cell wall biosynthesis